MLTNPKDIARFWQKVLRRSATECWPWTAAKLSNGGYGAFRVSGHTKRAHVIAYELHTGTPVESGLVVMHLCNNTACCNPYHLQLSTQADNMKHKALAGRAVGPKPNSRCKLTEEQLEFLRHSTLSQRAIGRILNIDHKSVARLRAEETAELLPDKPF